MRLIQSIEENVVKTKFFKQTTRKIPKGFQEVEYLESNSTQQRISTGITVDILPVTVDIAFSTVSASYNPTYQVIAGTVTGDQYFIGFTSGNPTFAVKYNNVTYNTNVTPVANTIYRLKATVSNSAVTLSINGTDYTSTRTYTANNEEIGLFAQTYGTGSNRIHACKIYKGSTLVRDLVPYLDANGRPCMWDMVGGKPYYNQGTGEFTYGRKIIPVEYLESTGTQYIDTGVKGKNNIDFEYKCVFTKIDTDAQCVGGVYEVDKNLYFGLVRSNSNFAYHYDGTHSPVIVSETTQQNVEYEIIGHMWSDNQYIDINGVRGGVGTLSGTFTSTSNMYLFANNSVSFVYSFIKLYNFKLYDNGALVRDFIPCIDENNTPYMFDKVTHSAFLNVGTGDFLYGDIVTERTETLRTIPIIRHLPLNYLESTGTQYIDTGIVAKSGLSTKLVLEYTALSSTSISMLDARSGDNRFYLCHCGNVSGYRFYYGYGVAVQTSLSPVINTKYTVETSLAVGSQSMKVNEATISTGSSSTEYNLGINLYLFGINYGTPQYLANAKVYSCKIWDSTTLVRDLIPVLKLPERIPCMYDRVSKTYFYNEGTGDFLYGFN